MHKASIFAAVLGKLLWLQRKGRPAITGPVAFLTQSKPDATVSDLWQRDVRPHSTSLSGEVVSYLDELIVPFTQKPAQ